MKLDHMLTTSRAVAREAPRKRKITLPAERLGQPDKADSIEAVRNLQPGP